MQNDETSETMLHSPFSLWTFSTRFYHVYGYASNHGYGTVVHAFPIVENKVVLNWKDILNCKTTDTNVNEVYTMAWTCNRCDHFVLETKSKWKNMWWRVICKKVKCHFVASPVLERDLRMRCIHRHTKGWNT